MRKDEQLRLLDILEDGIATGRTAYADGVMRSPAADFTCPDLLAQEQEVFFRETPLFTGLSCDLPEPGSYWADSQTGLPILMTRDEDGEFRAFANACRHRGAQVVPDGRGTKPRVSCPFHAWTYNTRGELIAVNRADSFGGIDRSQHSLVELPCAEKHGTLWVIPNPSSRETIDVDACLGELKDDMRHWELENYTHAATQVLEADVNWKLAIDTFGENYHFPVLHRDTLGPGFHGNLQTHDVMGLNYRMVFARSNFEEVAKAVPKRDQWPFRQMTLCVYFVYPNSIFLVDMGVVDVLRMFPDGTGRSRTAHSVYLTPNAADFFRRTGTDPRERFQGFNSVVQAEDYVMAASTQACAEAGIHEHFLFGRNEPALHHYHNAHRQGLGRPLLQVENS